MEPKRASKIFYCSLFHIANQHQTLTFLVSLDPLKLLVFYICSDKSIELRAVQTCFLQEYNQIFSSQQFSVTQ